MFAIRVALGLSLAAMLKHTVTLVQLRPSHTDNMSSVEVLQFITDDQVSEEVPGTSSGDVEKELFEAIHSLPSNGYVLPLSLSGKDGSKMYEVCVCVCLSVCLTIVFFPSFVQTKIICSQLSYKRLIFTMVCVCVELSYYC